MPLSIHLTGKAVRSTAKGLRGTAAPGFHSGSFHYVGNGTENGNKQSFPVPVVPKWVWVQQSVNAQYAAQRSDTMQDTRALASSTVNTLMLERLRGIPQITVSYYNGAGSIGNPNVKGRHYNVMWFGGDKVITGQYVGTGAAATISPGAQPVTGDVVVTMAAGNTGRAAVTILNLLGTSLGAGTPVTANASAAASVTSPSVSGNFILDAVIQGGGNGYLTKGTGQTPVDGRDSADSNGVIATSADFGVSYKTPGGATTMSWSHSLSGSRNWGLVAVPITGTVLGVGATVTVGLQDDAAIDPSVITTNHMVNPGTGMVIIAVAVHDDKNIASVTWKNTPATLISNYYPNLASARRIALYGVTSDISSGGTPSSSKAVFVSKSGGSSVVYRTTAMDTCLDLANADVSSTKITAITATTFSVGTDASVNQSGVTYDYIVFDDDTNFAVGSYTGTVGGGNDTTFPATAVGFPLNMALIRRRGAYHPAWKSTGMAVGAALYGPVVYNFHNALSSNFATDWWTSLGIGDGLNRIDDIGETVPGKFRVDDQPEVNADSATYYYLLTGNSTRPVPTDPELPDQGALFPPTLQDLTRIVKGLSFSTTDPGGYNACSFSLILTRAEAALFYQQKLGYGIHLYDGLTPMWEGRIATISLSDEGVAVTCEGYWASLADETLTTFFADDDFGKWKIPQEHIGNLSNIDSSMPPAPNHITTTKGEQSIIFSGTSLAPNGTTHINYIYYTLPRTGHLPDARIYAPNTISAIQFTAVSTLYGDADNLLKVWTADFAKGTWVERHVESIGTSSAINEATGKGITRTINLVPISDDDYGHVEAIAIGIRPTGIAYTFSSKLVITNLRVYARRAPLGEGRNTPTRMILDLLRGAPPLITRPHGQQIEPDSYWISENDLEVIPARFSGQSFNEILNQLSTFGSTIVYNWIDNPSLEEDSVGWHRALATTSPSVTRVEDEDGVYGAFAAEGTLTRTAGQLVGIRTRPRNDLLQNATSSSPDTTSLFGVAGSTKYQFMARTKRTSGADSQYMLRIDWYDEDSVYLSSSDQNFTITTAYANYAFTTAPTSPATAVAANVAVITQSANTDTAPVIRVSAARFCEDPSNLLSTNYVDGNTPGYGWMGSPNQSLTVKTHPLTTGVFGHRQLHIRARDEGSVKWIIPTTAMTLKGVEFERDGREQWTRVWSRYTEIFSGEEKVIGPLESKIGAELTSPFRNTEHAAGQADKGFAGSSLAKFLEQHELPAVRSQVAISGYVLNSFGGKEPCWRIRSGDLIVVPDLVPLSANYTRSQLATNNTRRDRMKVFIVKETNYTADSDELTLVPDNMLDNLERSLANISIVASIRASAGSGGGTWTGGGGGAGAFIIFGG